MCYVLCPNWGCRYDHPEINKHLLDNPSAMKRLGRFRNLRPGNFWRHQPCAPGARTLCRVMQGALQQGGGANQTLAASKRLAKLYLQLLLELKLRNYHFQHWNLQLTFAFDGVGDGSTGYDAAAPAFVGRLEHFKENWTSLCGLRHDLCDGSLGDPASFDQTQGQHDSSHATAASHGLVALLSERPGLLAAVNKLLAPDYGCFGGYAPHTPASMAKLASELLQQMPTES